MKRLLLFMMFILCIGVVTADYTLTNVETIQIDSVSCRSPSFLMFNVSTYIIACSGSGFDGYISSFSVDDNYQMTRKTYLEHDDSYGDYNNLIKINDTTIGLLYDSPSHGKFKFFSINSSRHLTEENAVQLSATTMIFNDIELIDDDTILTFFNDGSDQYLRTYNIEGYNLSLNYSYELGSGSTFSVDMIHHKDKKYIATRNTDMNLIEVLDNNTIIVHDSFSKTYDLGADNYQDIELIKDDTYIHLSSLATGFQEVYYILSIADTDDIVIEESGNMFNITRYSNIVVFGEEIGFSAEFQSPSKDIYHSLYDLTDPSSIERILHEDWRDGFTIGSQELLINEKIDYNHSIIVYYRSSGGGYAEIYSINMTEPVPVSPVINITSPPVYKSIHNLSEDFIFTPTDPQDDDMNCSLYVDDISVSTLEDIISGVETTIPYTFSTWNQNHSWYINCTDGENYGVSDIRYYYTMNNDPYINLISPDNYHTTENLNITFIFNVTDDDSDMLSCSLYINDSYISNKTGIPDTYNLSYLHTSYGSYSWYINCSDISSEIISDTRYFNITEPVNQGLNISLISPLNDTNVSSLTVNHVFNATDLDSDNMTCSLYIDDIFIENKSVLSSSVSSFSYTNPSYNQTYTWYINCTDGDLFNVSDIWQYSIDIEHIIIPLNTTLNTAECPVSSTGLSILFSTLCILAFLMLLLGISLNNAIFTTLSGIMFIILAFSLYGCSLMIGAVFIFIGIFLLVTGLFRQPY